MPEAFSTNSVLEGVRAATLPAAMASAWLALNRRTYSLNAVTSSSLEIDCSGVKSPEPLKAIAVTDGASMLICVPKLSHGAVKYKYIGVGASGRYGKRMVQRETA